MVTFLAPAAFVAAIVLIAPVIVHLFKPRKTRVVPFSSLRWLRTTHQRLSRRIQWHQWLLFLVRATALALLVFALARPLWTTGSAASDRIVIVDTGHGMIAGWDAARAATIDVLKDGAEGRTAVIAADQTARLVEPPSADPSAAAIDTLKPGARTTDFTDSLALADALAAESNRPTEIVLVTNNSASAWSLPAVKSRTTNPAKVRVIEIPSPAAKSAGIVSARIVTADGKSRLVADVAAHGGELERTFRVDGVAGWPEESRAITIEPGQLTRITLPIPEGIERAGQVARLRLEPGDETADDDVFFLPLETSAPRVLLLEPKTPGADGRPVGLYVRSALEALSAAEVANLEVTPRTPATVGIDDVRKADVILALGVLDIAEPIRDAIESRVRAGAGLILWLGPQFDAAVYRRLWHRPLQPTESLSPLAVEDDLRRLARGTTLTDVRRSHPMLAGLRDPVAADGLRGEFLAYARLTGEPGKKDAVLARLGDGTPAIIDHPLGAGRVLTINSSANDEWSDLPRRQGFLPMLDRAIASLAGGGGRTFLVGEPITLAVAGWPEAIRVVGPDGADIVPRFGTSGGVRMLRLDGGLAPGVYTVTAEGRSLPLAINAGPREPAIPMDTKTLADWWAPTPVDVGPPVHTPVAGVSGRLWPVLAVLSGLFLMVEILYASWLCPRRQPELAAGLVTRSVARPVAGGAA